MQAVQTGRQDMEGRYRKARQLELQGTSMVQADTVHARKGLHSQPRCARKEAGSPVPPTPHSTREMVIWHK